MGSIGFTASALGILTAGIVITKFKPRARVLTLWNVFIGLATACCIFSFALLGCTQNDNSVKVNFDATCNADCHCDFVRYSPVCGTDGLTYTSACHAGCNAVTTRNSSKLFTSCSCISSKLENSATSGPCTVNCDFMLTIFLAVTSLMKFLGASGRASNFLVGIRCIEKEDKAVALGFGMALVRLFASVPSPIFFGYILDSACLVFGKTCSRRGNCWLYDGEYLRYSFNFIAGASILIGACLDLSVWHFSGDLKIFDDEEDEKDTVKAKENQN